MKLAQPRIDAIAARSVDGKLWIALTNVDPNQPARTDAQIDGIRARAASGTVLTADRVDAVNSYDRPYTVVSRPISAHVNADKMSVTLPAKWIPCSGSRARP